MADSVAIATTHKSSLVRRTYSQGIVLIPCGIRRAGDGVRLHAGVVQL